MLSCFDLTFDTTVIGTIIHPHYFQSRFMFVILSCSILWQWMLRSLDTTPGCNSRRIAATKTKKAVDVFESIIFLVAWIHHCKIVQWPIRGANSRVSSVHGNPISEDHSTRTERRYMFPARSPMTAYDPCYPMGMGNGNPCSWSHLRVSSFPCTVTIAFVFKLKEFGSISKCLLLH